MYVHLGGDLVVAVNEVVAILDVRLVEAAEINREFLDRATSGKIVRGGGLPPDRRALVVTTDAVFTSGISVATLARRMTHPRQSAEDWKAGE